MKSILGKLLLVVASALVTWLAVDLVLLAVHGPVRAVEDFYEPAPRYGYRMRPDLEFLFASPYHGYHAAVRTNRLGLRDDDVAVPKPAPTFRILLVGDSMTAGLEVERSRTFEAVCEARLRAHGPVEVVNAGVRGWNLDNIVGWLESDGLALEPDLVVYTFVDNDIMTEDEFRPAGSDVSRGFTLRGALGRLATWSHLTYRLEILRQTRALRAARDGRPEASATLPGGLVAFFTNDDWGGQPAYLRTARRIERLANASRGAGAEFVLAGAPQREEVDPATQAWWSSVPKLGAKRLDFDGARRYLDWVAAELGVARFDPIPEFRRRLAADRDYWFHHDGHLNERGHLRMGELLAAWIEGQPRFQHWQQQRAAR